MSSAELSTPNPPKNTHTHLLILINFFRFFCDINVIWIYEYYKESYDEKKSREIFTFLIGYKSFVLVLYFFLFFPISILTTAKSI